MYKERNYVSKTVFQIYTCLFREYSYWARMTLCFPFCHVNNYFKKWVSASFVYLPYFTFILQDSHPFERASYCFNSVSGSFS